MTSDYIPPQGPLDSEAMRPASADDIMAVLGNLESQPAKPAAPTTRRRGRPPGSKNKTPLQKAAELNPDLAAQVESEAKREAKKKRAAEIESAIYTELNDQLMTILIGALNIPSDFLYLPGKEPVVTQKDTRFTELGNRLAIPPNLAKSIGRLASELEQTDIGSKVGGMAQNNNVGLIVASGMTIFGLVQYAKQLSDTMEKVKPLLDARKRYLEVEAEEQVSRAKHAAPETDSAVSNSGSVS